jgi:hypothetical protein
MGAGAVVDGNGSVDGVARRRLLTTAGERRRVVAGAEVEVDDEQ